MGDRWGKGVIKNMSSSRINLSPSFTFPQGPIPLSPKNVTPYCHKAFLAKTWGITTLSPNLSPYPPEQQNPR